MSHAQGSCDSAVPVVDDQSSIQHALLHSLTTTECCAEGLEARGDWGREEARTIRPYEPQQPPHSMLDLPTASRSVRSSVKIGTRRLWSDWTDFPPCQLQVKADRHIPFVSGRDLGTPILRPIRLPIEPGKELDRRIKDFVYAVVLNDRQKRQILRASFPIMRLALPGLCGLTMFQFTCCTTHALIYASVSVRTCLFNHYLTYVHRRNPKNIGARGQESGVLRIRRLDFPSRRAICRNTIVVSSTTSTYELHHHTATMLDCCARSA